jgi:undecaprenyl diphosphate synthase
VLDPLRRDTSKGDAMTLTLALSYGGREEIADAVREVARRVAAGTMSPDDVTPEALRGMMPSLAVGDPDLVIRTGGERRISNFLLYGLAYAELFFVDALWPEFQASDLYDAIASYQARERRFGRVGQPAEPDAFLETGDEERAATTTGEHLVVEPDAVSRIAV